MNKNRGNWKSVLKADPTGWLLESNNPPVRYFTLKDILERAENDPEVRDARKSIMTAGIVPRILEQQNEDGSWGVPDDFYLGAKYKGTVWNIIVLAELGADGKDTRIRKAAEFILANSQDKQSGGFAVLERFTFHDVTPMAGRVANTQEDGPVLPARFGKGLLAPGIPVHRVVLVLEQIGRFLAREAVRAAQRDDGGCIAHNVFRSRSS